MGAIQTQRSPGVPGSAFWGLVSFCFLVVIAPCFYAAAILFGLSSKTDPGHWLGSWFYGALVWIALCVGGVLGPAVRGKLWAIQGLRVLSFICLAAYATMLIGDIVQYFRTPAPQKGMELFLLGVFFAPLGLCVWLLIRALRYEPWFNPNSEPEAINPSYGTLAATRNAAHLGASGQLPDEERASVLAVGTPPPRWLCYLVPFYATARLRRWGWFALMLPLGVVALAFAVAIPVRALIVYLVLGVITDRLRAIQQLRLDAARASPQDRKPVNRRPQRKSPNL